MDLSRNVIKRFVEVASPTKVTSSDTTVYGYITGEGDELYVKIDGSDVLTPITPNIDVREGDRVLVLIKNHEAVVIGSPSAATARLEELRNLEGEVDEFGVILADKVGVGELVAMQATIEELQAKDVVISGQLEANQAKIESLVAENVEIEGKLTAYQADIEELEATKLSVDEADIRYASIDKIEAVEAEFEILESAYGNFENLVTNRLIAVEADIQDLDTNKLSAEQADLKYVNIDFANVEEAWFDEFYALSGIIQNVTISEGVVVKELIGVTIKGDLIEAGTLKADRLVVLGSDGNYYKLNTDFKALPGVEPVEEDAIHGSVLIAESITAEKISVDDLVAFDATIGGFNITEKAIYSGVKESADNTTRGIYLDSDGQMAIGDSNNFIKFYKDQNGEYKLEISLVKSIQEQIDNLENIEIGGRNLIRNSKTLIFDDYYFVNNSAVLGNAVIGKMILGEE